MDTFWQDFELLLIDNVHPTSLGLNPGKLRISLPWTWPRKAEQDPTQPQLFPVREEATGMTFPKSRCSFPGDPSTPSFLRREPLCVEMPTLKRVKTVPGGL